MNSSGSCASQHVFRESSFAQLLVDVVYYVNVRIQVSLSSPKPGDISVISSPVRDKRVRQIGIIELSSLKNSI